MPKYCKSEIKHTTILACFINVLGPPVKKRRVDDDEEGWDDSLEFTQADLDDLEMLASQVKPLIAGFICANMHQY